MIDKSITKYKVNRQEMWKAIHQLAGYPRVQADLKIILTTRV